jgi:hypothetical protein
MNIAVNVGAVGVPDGVAAKESARLKITVTAFFI